MIFQGNFFRYAKRASRVETWQNFYGTFCGNSSAIFFNWFFADLSNPIFFILPFLSCLRKDSRQ